MAFERTPAGQANRAVFFRSDLVCYVEGNPESEAGVDVLFWCTVFRALAPDLRVHCTPRGGKPVVETLARTIVADEVSGTIAAIDRDYSEFREGGYIDDPRVFYTHGYSWENDAFSREQLEPIASNLARVQSLPQASRIELDEDFNRLHSSVGKIVFADFVAILRGGSVLDREKPGKYFEKDDNNRPVLSKSRCLNDVSKAKVNLAGRELRNSVGVPRQGTRYLWGKAYEHYIRMGLATTISTISGRAMSYDHIRDVAIHSFGQCLTSGQNSECLDYYRQLWARFTRLDS